MRTDLAGLDEMVDGTVFAEGNGLRLVAPELLKGIGSVILAPDSRELIHGMQVIPFAVWPDDRGYFLEVLRFGQGGVAAYSAATTQVSAALSYPGTVKAFHYHLHQTDLWVPAAGNFQFAMVDIREGSPTFGRRNTFYAGAQRPWQVMIPPGVAHGYKVIGRDPAMLVYATDRFYNPSDEGRIAHTHPGLAYDWETQHK